MKKKIVIVYLLVLLLPSFSMGQEDKSFLFFNELSLSVNRSVVKNDNTSNRFGFGFGLHKSWMDSSWFNLLTGISYDKTSQFKNNVYNGSFSNVSDVTYNLHSLSIPVLARFNVGRSMKFFVESGLFLELNVRANREGTFRSSIPGEGIQEVFDKEKIKVSNPNGGFLLGIGSSIPISNYAFIVKFGYQFAMNDLGSFQESLFNRYARISIGFRKN